MVLLSDTLQSLVIGKLELKQASSIAGVQEGLRGRVGGGGGEGVNEPQSSHVFLNHKRRGLKGGGLHSLFLSILVLVLSCHAELVNGRVT